MKKFKLIKEYPGSPKLGDILLEGAYTTPKNERFIYNVGEDKEFWEEIVEKEYEILMWSDRNNSYSHSLRQVNENFVIRSVKRLSDGEIFTIGDPIIAFASTDCCITKINLSSNGIVQFELTKFKDMDLYQPTVLLKNAKKARQKLFTTKDGVDIFKGDTYYYIDCEATKQFLLCFMSNLDYSSDLYTRHTTFYSKEKAVEYILLNKPCLSVNDILNSGMILSIQKGLWFKLAKEKLKL